MSELKPCPACGSEAVITGYGTLCPAPLRWTNEPPTEPGWYWFRNLSKPQIVHTSGIKNRKPHPADEWAGPIQEPEEE